MSLPLRRPSDPDLLVIGGGTAGLVAAHTAAGLGARVVLIERAPSPGGDCLWTGCVPSKTLIAIASTVATARQAAAYGLEVAGPVDFAAVMAEVKRAITTIEPVDSAATLEAAGVTVIRGTARLTGPNRVEVDGRSVRFRQAVLATGSVPAVPPIDGLAEVDYLTNESLWDLTELPPRLVILGGGTIGCELAQAFTRLGSRVTLIETADRVMPSEDPLAAPVVEGALRADGVHIELGRPVSTVRDGSLTLDDEQVEFDQILVATGRTPATSGLGTEAAGVELDDTGCVLVDQTMRTTNPRIWAAGDLTSYPRYTHAAGMHAQIAASNALLGVRRTITKVLLPRVTYTNPEVAAVGVLPSEAVDEPGLRVITTAHSHVDRAIAEDATAGFTSVVVDRRSRLVGALVVSPRAGETIGEATLAIQSRTRMRDLAATTHPYPTFSDGLWNAAIDDVRASLGKPVPRLAFRTLVRLRRFRSQLEPHTDPSSAPASVIE